MLKNPFYIGRFIWQRREYAGTHPPLVDSATFRRVQDIIATHNSKAKARKHTFAFGGLINCRFDKCKVTAELHKKKYVYYRCTFGRGKCGLPYMPETELSDQLGVILKDIQVPKGVVEGIAQSIRTDRERTVSARRQQTALVQRGFQHCARAWIKATTTS